MTIANDIVAEARKMLGTPFHHQGRNPVSGVDCAGLVYCVAEAVGAERADAKGYPTNVSTTDVEAVLASCCDSIELEDAQPGDILTFKIPRCGTKHMAILTDVGMIHAWLTARRVMEHAMTRSWLDRRSRAFRMRSWQQ